MKANLSGWKVEFGHSPTDRRGERLHIFSEKSLRLGTKIYLEHFGWFFWPLAALLARYRSVRICALQTMGRLSHSATAETCRARAWFPRDNTRPRILDQNQTWPTRRRWCQRWKRKKLYLARHHWPNLSASATNRPGREYLPATTRLLVRASERGTFEATGRCNRR